MGTAHNQTGKRTAGSDRGGRWLARRATPALVAVTLGIALTGGFVAIRTIADSADAARDFTDGRVSTSFGALWVDSFREVTVPQMIKRGHMGVPVMGDPDKVSFEVSVRLANTTAAPVELTPARFGLRLGPGDEPISVEGATFESVRLLAGGLFDGRVQFPVEEGEHLVSLLFDDPDGSGPITIDLGRIQFQKPAGDNGQHH